MAPKKPRTIEDAASKNKALVDEIQSAIQDTELPRLYFNGFSITLSTGDILIVLKRNDIPIAVLNASYTVAKTLVQKIDGVIGKLEDVTGNIIMTTNDIDISLAKVKHDE